MSYLARDRNKRLRDFNKRLGSNNGPDRNLMGWRLIDIHQELSKFEFGQGMDFWCCNGNDMYLLMIEKSTETELSVVKRERSTVCLVSRLDFDLVTDKLIEQVLRKFEIKGIPKYRTRQVKTAYNKS